MHIIPNSQIATVSNLSRDYSVAALAVSVDATADPDRVLTLLRSLAQDIRSDVAFKEVIVADPDVPGVDKINGREVIYPVNIRVRPNQKDGVLRELKAYCRSEKLAFRFDVRRGKGGHGTVFVGDRFTTVQSELTAGRIEALLKQLGLPKDAV